MSEGPLGTTKETVRLEAFSDGVFAIAITLLVLELRVDTGRPLRDALAALWPNYLAYVAAFLTILVMWLSHHGLLLWVRRVEGSLLVANGIVLMFVALVPFPTMLVGEYGRHLDADDGRVAVAVFAGLFLAINLAFAWLWALVVRKRATVAPGLPDPEVRLTNRFLGLGLAGYAAAVGLAFVEPRASLALTLLLVAFWLWNAYRRHQMAMEAAA